ncbi:MAG: hypothetical protein M3O15_00830 [Acidobacteriota bacterium]|nr:hypothetical protein [Acidobacteriota bacterium]
MLEREAVDCVMTQAIDKLTDAVGDFNAHMKKSGTSMAEALRAVRADLTKLLQDASQGKDSGELLRLVNTVYILIDCASEAISPGIAEKVLEEMGQKLTAVESDPFDAYILHGDEIQVANPCIGCHVVNWGNFRRFLANRYGKSGFSPSHETELRKSVDKGELLVPEQEVRLGRIGGVVWFTDEDLLLKLASGSGKIDGNLVYDLLALDWSGAWDVDSVAGTGAWAVLISLPLGARGVAARGLRVPTAIDGWGCLMFVPRDSKPAGRWPSFAGFTVDPRTDKECLPEGVHGALMVSAGQSCPVTSCGRVTRRIDRAEEYGDQIARRAIARLAQF